MSVHYNALPVWLNYAFSGGIYALSKNIMHLIHTVVSEREIMNNGKNLKQGNVINIKVRHKQSN